MTKIKILLSSFLLISPFSFAGNFDLLPVTSVTSFYEALDAQAKRPLSLAEINQIEVFRERAIGEIPKDILEDLKLRGLGFRGRALREYSDYEKIFLKNNLKNLSILKFLVFINLKGQELDDLPENFKEFENLGLINLADNNFTQIPGSILELRKTKKFFIELSENDLPSEVTNKLVRECCEMLFEGNKYSLLAIKDTAWHEDFIGYVPKEKDEEEAKALVTPEHRFFTPLIEYILLAILEGNEEKFQDWLGEGVNKYRLYQMMGQKTAPEVIQMFSKTKIVYDNVDNPQFIKQLMLEAVIDHLVESGLMRAHGEEIQFEDSKEKTYKKLTMVQGWKRFFTHEPLECNEDVWFTQEGVQVLFNMIGILDHPCLPGLSKADHDAYERLHKETNIPLMLSEDIRFFRTIGFREKHSRPLSLIEKKWISQHLQRLAELPFIKVINLMNLDLKDVPANFVNFKDLRILMLSHNHIEHMTDHLTKLRKTFPTMVMKLTGNPVRKGYGDLYDAEIAIFEKFKAQVGEIPASLQKEICNMGTLGMRGTQRSDYTDGEKAWVKKHISKLSMLTFLHGLNLSGMELDRLPAHYAQLIHLQYIFLVDNNFTEIPTVLSKLHALNRELTIDVSGNPLPDDAKHVFQEKVLKKVKQLLVEKDLEFAREKKELERRKKREFEARKKDIARKVKAAKAQKAKEQRAKEKAEIEEKRKVAKAEAKRKAEIKQQAQLEEDTRIKALEQSLDQSNIDISALCWSPRMYQKFGNSDREARKRDNTDEAEISSTKKYYNEFFNYLMSVVAENELSPDQQEWQCQMLYCFMHGYTPKEAIIYLSHKDLFLKGILEVKKQINNAYKENPELYSFLKPSSRKINKNMLIKQIKLIEKPLKEHLKRQHKYIETQRRTTKKKKIIEIGLDKFIKDGWYTRQAIAELLTALDFVE